MTQRLDYFKAAPKAAQAVLALENYATGQSGLEARYVHLLKLRASQINGCAYCVDMHVKESRQQGFSEQWIALVSAWSDSPIYDAKERAVLRWTEAVTRVADTHVPDDVFAELKAHFNDEEIVNLTLAVGTINIWNRLAISFRVPHPLDAAA